MENIIDVNFTTEEKGLIASIINRFGTGQHPYADPNEGTFNYFKIAYLKDLLNTKRFNEAKENLRPEMLTVLNNIKEKINFN